jgi:cyanate permease
MVLKTASARADAHSKKPFSLAKPKLPTIFFGWWMLIVMSIVSGLSMGFMSDGQSALFKNIAADLNLNRADTSVGTAIASLFNGIMFPVTGVLCTRIGTRKPVLIGITLMGAGLT